MDDVCESYVVHTGQNYDPKLYDVFYDDLRIRRPDEYLGVDTSSLASVLADTFVGIERVINEQKPDAFFVLGDTNSGLSAIIAKRMGIPVVHMEAGNRSFDSNVPEETNRRLIDGLASINLCYSENARYNLLSEGMSPQRTYLCGSPLREVLEYYADDIDASTILYSLGLSTNQFFLLSLHREENVDNPERLMSLLSGAEQISAAYQLPVIMSTHPRTRKRLESIDHGADIIFCDPFGYFDYVKLQFSARCVISDSGTVAIESAMLQFPAVTPRDSIERTEAIDSGSIIPCGNTPDGMTDAVATTLSNRSYETPQEYNIRNTSQRVVNAIIGLSRLSPIWEGRRNR